MSRNRHIVSRILLLPFYALVVAGAAEALSTTTVTLNSSPNPANYGQPVTLTATVTSGATGKVTFYDGTSVLGVGTLAGATATLTTTLLPSGTRSLRAYYAGDSGNSPSSSATLSHSIVPGVSLGLRAPVNYPVGAGPSSVAVGDFNGDFKQDLVVASINSNKISVLLGNGDGTFRAAVNYATGLSPNSVVVGDFNGDGKPDLAVANYASGTISVLLGNGDGTFQNAANSNAGNSPLELAVGDFNGDGKADLAVAAFNTAADSMRVLLGNGDGTFQPPVNYAGPNSSTSSVAVGDLNQDGKADLAFGSGNGSIYVLLGKGDGTFRAAVSYSAASSPYVVTIGDFNGDGTLDLAASNGNYFGSVEVLLGNGDGTFQTAAAYNVGQYPWWIAAVDLNGDGVLDLICSSTQNSTMSVSLGYGNGIFQGPVTYTVPGYSSSLAVGDFNGDGKVDVVVANNAANSISVLLGGAIPDLTIALTHGNGFTQGQAGASYKLTVSNIGDIASAGAVGVTDTLPPGFTGTSIAGAGWTCALATLTCTRSDSLAPGASYPPIMITVTVGNQAGSATDTATVSGGGDGNTANNTAADTTMVRFTTNVGLTSSPNPSALGQAVTLTATVTNGTGKVTFYDGTTMLGVGTISAGQATLTTSQLPSGSHSLTARFDGDANYGSVLSPARVQTVNAVTTNAAQISRSYPVGAGPNSVAVGDFNRDGKLDLVTGNQNDVSVLLGSGDGTFQPAVSYGAQTNLSLASVAIGDVNGDGKPDLAIAYTNGSLFVLLGNGDGTFQNPAQVTGTIGSSNYSADLIVTDINRDGLADLVVMTSSGVSVFIGNGDGTFQAPLTNSTTGFSQGDWALSDMNNDGNLDIVFTDYYGSTVSVMPGNGDGTFQPPIQSSGAFGNEVHLVVGDFNGDGRSDVVEVYYGGVNTLLGNGDGTLRSPVASNFFVDGVYIVAADFNGDGKLDFAYRGNYNNTFTVVFGNGDGTFKNASTFQTDGGYGGIVMRDFNGDGRPDFVAANRTTNTISVFLGGQFSGLAITATHSGKFTAGATGSYQITVNNPAFAITSGAVSVTDTLPAGLTATAMSGNGWSCTIGTLTCTRSDGLATGNSFSPITVNVAVAANLSPSTLNNQVSVSYNGAVNTASDATSIVLASTTALVASPSPAVLGQVVTLTAAVTGTGTLSGSFSFFDGANFLASAALSSGHTTLTTRLLPVGAHALTATYSGDSTHAASHSSTQLVTVNAAVSSGFAAPSAYTTGAGPIAVVTGDFNGDGKPDLATPNSTANTVSVLLGNGDGTFHSKVDYAVGTQPASIVVGDFNGDGKQDLAVANQGGQSLSILLGNGDGTFQAASTITLNQPPIYLAAADFDRDSNLDLLVTLSDGEVRLLLGNGDGTFHAAANSVGPGDANAAVAADLNGDGKADVAIVTYAGIYTLLGNGDGTFQSYSYISGSYGSTFLTVGDLNGDGIPDILTTDNNSGGVDVFLGNGDGTFQYYKLYATGTSPLAVATADVNGDGKLDVVASNSVSNTLSVLLGNGDGTLQPKLAYPTGSGPRGIAVGDFNGDGRTDLAVANLNSNNITVFLGMLTSVLEISSTHSGNFLFNQTGATYTITVSNGGPGPTSGTLTVVDTLPAGLTATGISGTGWTCTLSTLTCTQPTSLSVGASASPITVFVTVAPNAPSQVTNLVSASAPGSVSANWSDLTNITALPPPVLLSPTSGQTGVSQTASLAWTAAAGATSYDVYFGTQTTPLLAANTTATSYSPGTMAPSTVYYWRVVSKNASGSASSATLSFMTVNLVITGHVTVSGVALSGVTISLNGAPAATTDASGNYSVTPAPGGTYTLSASLSGYSFSAPATFSNLNSNQTANFTGLPLTNSCVGMFSSVTNIVCSAMNQNAFQGSPAVSIGGQTTYGAMTLSGNVAFGDAAGMALYNSGGGGGASVSLDMYNTFANGGIPQAKIKAIDDANYSDHLTFWTKTPGSPANPVTEKVRITSTGNVGIGTTNPTRPLQIGAGAFVTAGGVWTNASDRNLKENFVPANPGAILQEIAALPLMEWNYKSEDPSIRHIGPVAQDFYSIFGVGNSSTSISTIDPSGIALAGIQGLDEKSQTRAARLAELKKQLDAKTDELRTLQERLERFESLFEKATSGANTR